jgi:serine/threonine protein kinase
LQQLGHGKFGQVYAARELQTDFVVALKKMSRLELSENNFEKQIRREVIIQSSLKHDNILKLFGYFWDEETIYLILEYAPGG